MDADPLGGVGAALNLAAHSPAPGLRSLGVASDAPLWKDVVPGLDVTTPYGDPHRPAHTLDEFLVLLDNELPFRIYSWVVFDSPPVIGGMQLRQLIRVADELVLVIRAEPMAFRAVPGFLKLIKAVRDEGGSVQLRGMLLTLPAGEPLGGSWETELRRVFSKSLLPHAVPFDPEVGRALLLGKPVLVVNQQAPASRQYAGLAQRLGLIPADADTVDLFRDGREPAVKITAIPAAGGPPADPVAVRELLGEPVPDLVESFNRVLPDDELPPFPGLEDTARLRPEQVPSPSAVPPQERPVRPTDPADRGTARGHAGDVTAVAFGRTAPPWPRPVGTRRSRSGIRPPAWTGSPSAATAASSARWRSTGPATASPARGGIRPSGCGTLRPAGRWPS